MMRKRAVLWRAVVLLGLVALTAYQLHATLHNALEHQRLAAEVRALDAHLDAQKTDYSGSLAERQRLQQDPDEQLRLLKERMGYARKNEIPIVVTIEAPVD